MNCIKYTNPMRRVLRLIVDRSEFEWVMILIILGNTIQIALDNPLHDSNSRMSKVLQTLDYLFTIIFIFEAIAKTLAHGLVNCGK